MGKGYSTLSKPWKNFLKFGSDIDFLPEKSNFYEGEQFKGKLVLNLDKNGIGPFQADISIEGFEYVYWEEHHTYNDGHGTKHYTVPIEDGHQVVG